MNQARLRHPASVLGVGLAVIAWVYLVVVDVPVGDAVVIVAVAGSQMWAGSYVWHVGRGARSGGVETVGMGLALGPALGVLAGLLVFLITGSNAGWVAPAAIALVVLLFRRRRRADANLTRRVDAATLVGVATTVVVGLLSFVPNILNYPLAWTGVWSRYHGDMLFFESLSTSLARLGPLDSIYSPGMQVRYHWLVYAWSGQVSEAASAGPFVLLTRVIPFIAVIGSGLIAVVWTRRLTSALWAPPLAVVLLVLGGYVGATYGAVFNFDSPSQSITSLWLLAYGLCIVVVIPSRSSGRRFTLMLLLVAVLAFSLTAGKVSTGAVATAAIVWVATVAMIFRVPWAQRAVAIAAVTVVAALSGYLLVVSGSADPGGLKLFSLLDRASSIQGLNPVAGSIGIIAGTAILVLAVGVRWAGLAWQFADRDSRLTVDTQLGLGLVIAAVATIVILSGGMNDTWFALAASAPLAVLSAAGAGNAWLTLSTNRGKVLLSCALVALLAFLVTWLLWETGASGGNVWVGTFRWLGPIAGSVIAVLGGLVVARVMAPSDRRSWLVGVILALVLLSAPGRLLGLGSGMVGVQPGLGSGEFSPVESFSGARDSEPVVGWSDGQNNAAAWLRMHASEADVVATNVTFSPFVPAVTRLQTLASGLLYQAPYGRPGAIPVLLQREAASWAFVDDPSAETSAVLCQDGVRWVWVNPKRTESRDWRPWATTMISSEDVMILQKECPDGN